MVLMIESSILLTVLNQNRSKSQIKTNQRTNQHSVKIYREETINGKTLENAREQVSFGFCLTPHQLRKWRKFI